MCSWSSKNPFVKKSTSNYGSSFARAPTSSSRYGTNSGTASPFKGGMSTNYTNKYGSSYGRSYNTSSTGYDRMGTSSSYHQPNSKIEISRSAEREIEDKGTWGIDQLKNMRD